MSKQKLKYGITALLASKVEVPTSHRNIKVSSDRADILLRMHRLHLGLYRRIADCLGVDASFVSKVAGGTRKSEPVRGVLLKELAVLAIMAT